MSFRYLIKLLFSFYLLLYQLQIIFYFLQYFLLSLNLICSDVQISPQFLPQIIIQFENIIWQRVIRRLLINIIMRMALMTILLLFIMMVVMLFLLLQKFLLLVSIIGNSPLLLHQEFYLFSLLLVRGMGPLYRHNHVEWIKFRMLLNFKSRHRHSQVVLLHSAFLKRIICQFPRRGRLRPRRPWWWF